MRLRYSVNSEIIERCSDFNKFPLRCIGAIPASLRGSTVANAAPQDPSASACRRTVPRPPVRDSAAPDQLQRAGSSEERSAALLFVAAPCRVHGLFPVSGRHWHSAPEEPAHRQAQGISV
ncbi:uncharacterized protein LOC112966523 isoform X3 [Apteryx rowi]|uniref:uncharacterized protein LOC112966523 isoform X3 n=1 Tax=Apteryx rowi TaxID=308060 RepID=UPI000E1CDD49|nr:uncharacterized protein LOC112966523 isoform X3 [Apteryx rowi]